MFDLEKFKSGKYYVHLPSLEVYNKAMKYLEDNGFKWVRGQSPTDKATNEWNAYQQQTCIYYHKSCITQGLQYAGLDYYKERGYTKLEINEVEKGETNMNETMKRDLIKLLFEKEFSSYDLKNMYEYKGRIITDYLHKNAMFIDFIEKINKEYGIKGHEIADIIINEFDISEYKEEEQV